MSPILINSPVFTATSKHCCSVLTGVSSHLLSRLQSIMNAAARLIFYARRSEHVTPLLHDLHWLRVPERIQSDYVFWHSDIFMVLRRHTWPTVFVAPSMSPVVNVCVHPTWPRSSSRRRVGQPSVTVPFQWPLQGPEPSACVSPGRDVLIDVSSRTEDIPFPL